MLATDAKRDQELQLPNIRKVFNKLIGFELKVRGFRIENCLCFCGWIFYKLRNNVCGASTIILAPHFYDKCHKDCLEAH